MTTDKETKTEIPINKILITMIAKGTKTGTPIKDLTEIIPLIRKTKIVRLTITGRGTKTGIPIRDSTEIQTILLTTVRKVLTTAKGPRTETLTNKTLAIIPTAEILISSNKTEVKVLSTNREIKISTKTGTAIGPNKKVTDMTHKIRYVL